MRPWVEKLIAAWGVAWVSLLLGRAIWRLGPLALEPWTENLMTNGQKGIYIAWLVANAYLEGYRGFQLRFSPRVVSRAIYLGQNPRPLWVVLALPFCMSLFHSTKRQMTVSWVFIGALILLIWWGMFWWSGHDSWYAYEYLFITLYAIVLFFLAAMLYPWDMKHDIDVREYFFRNRPWFYGVLFVAWCLDIPETVAKASAELRPVPEEYFWFVGLHLTIAAIGLITRKHIVHVLLPILWFLIVFFYVLLSSLGYIASNS